MNNRKIFVQIASYRDPQLLLTIKDCIAKAKKPNKLVFAISWQHSPEDTWDTLDEFKKDKRFIIKDIPYKESKGACWARNVLQQEYTDEEYTLQIDSHMRFEQDWDESLIKMLKTLKKKGHKKPLITSYACSFEPDTDPIGRITVPWKMNFDRFFPEGPTFFIPASIDEYKELDSPIPARFYSAHFAFADGSFVKEVPHDPLLYFHGEEITIAVRAFTWGYDLFHPHKVFLWHEYIRNNKKKQWDDDPIWVSRNNEAHKRTRQLLEMDNEVKDIDFGPYSLGTERTLDDYIKFSGVNFRTRSVQTYTLEHKNAPNPIIENEQEYHNSFHPFFKHCIDLYAPHFPETDYDFWVVSFEEKDGTVINRKDADENEVNRLLALSKSDSDWIRLWREYYGKKPDKYVVWPHSKSKGWLNRIEQFI
jgi:glycosyltransferase involved in cell wall biosynthesis